MVECLLTGGKAKYAENAFLYIIKCYVDWPRIEPGLPSSLFLDAFAKLLRVTVSFVMPVRPSARMEQLGSHWSDFYEM
jgi:hypothetical protein